MRAQEFAALQNSDIDLEKNIITIKRAVGKRFVDEDGGKVEEYLKVPKNKKQRIIYLSDIAKECIADMQRRTSTYCEVNCSSARVNSIAVSTTLLSKWVVHLGYNCLMLKTSLSSSLFFIISLFIVPWTCISANTYEKFLLQCMCHFKI